MNRHSSAFRTEAGKRQYLAAYEATLKLWPIPYESLFVPTQFGNTHLIVAGPRTGIPLVLLHGALASATMWFPNVADFSHRYRLYALDCVGDVNRSIPSSMPQNPHEIAQWLAEVFDQMSIQRAHVVGISLGGAYVLALALHAPERVASGVALAPAAGLSPLSFKFWGELIPPMLRSRGNIHSVLPRLTAPGAPESTLASPLFEQMNIGIQTVRMRASFPPVFRDEELRRIQTPLLLMFGEAEIMYDISKALARAKRLIANLETEIIPKAGHLLSIEQPEAVNRRILAFIESHT